MPAPLAMCADADGLLRARWVWAVRVLKRPELEPMRSARFVTVTSLCGWCATVRSRPWYLVRYLRFLRFKSANPHVVTRGFVFMDRGVEIYARRGYGRLILGSWVHLGAGTALRCHEGTLSIGDKSVLAAVSR